MFPWKFSDSATIALTLYINRAFDDDLNNNKSEKYINMSREAQTTVSNHHN